MYKNVCGLGALCHTARFMQRIHVKKTSYPFDWVWTDDTIIVDALEDDFKKFLDKSYYIEPADKYSDRMCGHSEYHESFFFHKNPRNEDDYQYYQRCVDRFRTMVKDGESKLFIVMFSPEKTKWPLDLSQMMEEGRDKSEIMEVMKQKGRNINNALRKVAVNYKLSVIMNFGNNPIQSFNVEHEDGMDFIELNTLTSSVGVTFNDGTYTTNQHPDNYFISGLMSEKYKFH